MYLVVHRLNKRQLDIHISINDRKKVESNESIVLKYGMELETIESTTRTRLGGVCWRVIRDIGESG